MSAGLRERARAVADILGRLLRRGNSGPRELAIVLVVSLVIAAPAWLVASAIAGPVRDLAARGECGQFGPGSALRHVCASGYAVGTLVLPAIWLFVLFRGRVWLADRVRAAMGVAPDLRYLALPTVGTLAFLVPWAFIHADTGARVGIVPQWTFPALVATIAHALHRYGPEVRGLLAEFFVRRDRLPRRARSALGVGIPLAFAVAVASEPGVGSATLREQVVALVSFGCGYLAIAPPLGRLAGAVGSAFDDVRPPIEVTSRANAFAARLRALVTRGAPGALLLVVLDAGRAYACSSHSSCESAPGYNVAIGVAGGVMALATTALAGDVAFQSLLAGDARLAKSGTAARPWLPGAPAIPWLPLGGVAIGTALILGICRTVAAPVAPGVASATAAPAAASPAQAGAAPGKVRIVASEAVIERVRFRARDSFQLRDTCTVKVWFIWKLAGHETRPFYRVNYAGRGAPEFHASAFLVDPAGPGLMTMKIDTDGKPGEWSASLEVTESIGGQSVKTITAATAGSTVRASGSCEDTGKRWIPAPPTLYPASPLLAYEGDYDVRSPGFSNGKSECVEPYGVPGRSEAMHVLRVTDIMSSEGSFTLRHQGFGGLDSNARLLGPLGSDGSYRTTGFDERFGPPVEGRWVRFVIEGRVRGDAIEYTETWTRGPSEGSNDACPAVIPVPGSGSRL